MKNNELLDEVREDNVLLGANGLNGLFFFSRVTFAITSGSGSSTGSAHSTVTTFPQTLTFPLINLRLACAADL